MRLLIAVLCLMSSAAFADTKTCKAMFGFSAWGAEVDDALMQMRVFNADKSFVVSGLWTETTKNSEIVYFLSYDYGKSVRITQTKKDYVANLHNYTLCLDAQTCSLCR